MKKIGKREKGSESMERYIASRYKKEDIAHGICGKKTRCIKSMWHDARTLIRASFSVNSRESSGGKVGKKKGGEVVKGIVAAVGRRYTL